LSTARASFAIAYAYAPKPREDLGMQRACAFGAATATVREPSVDGKLDGGENSADPVLVPHGPRAPASRRFALTCVAVAVGLAASARFAFGHELEIDQLRLWVDPAGQLRGQLILDPELTRRSDEVVTDSEARARIAAFASANVSAEVDGTWCSWETEARELYVLGGAAPGDVVMLKCSPKAAIGHLRVALGRAVPRLALEAVGFALAGEPRGTPAPVRVIPADEHVDYVRRTAASAVDATADAASATGAIAAGAITAGASAAGASAAGADDSGLGTGLHFLLLGVEHIVPGGFDHVLFVLGLTLRDVRLGALSWELAAFTLAHTLTLALGTLNWFTLPASVVEPLIALSIVAVALHNLLAPKPETPTDAALRAANTPRLALCFGFGLIHGLGFAGALSALGMSGQGLLPALLGFNLGVELGQLLVATIALLALTALRRTRAAVRWTRWTSLGVACGGAALFIARLG
jgi:hypothetical protein